MDIYQKIYTDRGLDIEPKILSKIIQDATKKAKSKYKELNPPKLLSEKLYIHACIRQAIIKDILLNRKNRYPPSEYKNSLDLYLAFSPEVRKKLREEINNAAIDQRSCIWDKYKIDYKKVEKAFTGLTIQRNIWAQREGFKTWLYKKLIHYQIPLKDYKRLINNIHYLISFCQEQLNKMVLTDHLTYSEFYKPCYICLSDSFPFRNIDEVKKKVFEKYKILKKYKDKIEIKFESRSSASYEADKDVFEICISKNENFRHQSLLLIHELLHVVDYLESFKEGFLPADKGEYYQEKKVLEMIMPFFRKNYPLFYPNMFSEFLRLFLTAFFEIEVYKNPNQNLSKLYAKAYNICYPDAKQKRNRSWILDENIFDYPLSTLPHVVAQSEVILKLINKSKTLH